MASTGEGTSGLEDNNILFGMTSGFTFRTTTRTSFSAFLHSSTDTTMLEQMASSTRYFVISNAATTHLL